MRVKSFLISEIRYVFIHLFKRFFGVIGKLCFLYKTVSCKARDAHIADMQARMQNGEDGEKTPKTTAPLGFLVDEDTAFYILPDRLTYAKSKGGTFTIDDYMSLVYTSLLCIGIWFALLNVLDPLVAFLGG